MTLIILVGIPTEHSNSHNSLCRTLIKRSRAIRALRYTTTIEVTPFLDLGKHPESSNAFSRAITLDPKFAHAYVSRAIVNSSLKKLDEVIADSSRAIELQPASTLAYFLRGTSYFSKDVYAKAVADLDVFIGSANANPAYIPDAYFLRGSAHTLLGNGQKGVDDLTRYITMKPTDNQVYTARAAAYRVLKKPDLAAADEKKAASMK